MEGDLIMMMASNQQTMYLNKHFHIIPLILTFKWLDTKCVVAREPGRVLSTSSVAGAEEPAWRTQPTKMTSSEAFTETLAANGTQNIFGIVGSAFMDALDIFPAAGIRFISVQHEQNAVHMADGYSRVTNRLVLKIY